MDLVQAGNYSDWEPSFCPLKIWLATFEEAPFFFIESVRFQRNQEASWENEHLLSCGAFLLIGIGFGEEFKVSLQKIFDTGQIKLYIKYNKNKYNALFCI